MQKSRIVELSIGIGAGAIVLVIAAVCVVRLAMRWQKKDWDLMQSEEPQITYTSSI
jgi:hypothetical protein